MLEERNIEIMGNRSKSIGARGLVAFAFGFLALLLPMLLNAGETNKSGFAVPRAWTRRGLVLARQKEDFGVSGDPCIVWDEAIKGWRMVFFYSPPGHAQAICLNRDDVGPGQWKLEGPLLVANPQTVGGFHKPFVV